MKSTIESKVAARDDLFVARRLLATKDPALIKLIPPELLDRIEREHLPDARTKGPMTGGHINPYYFSAEWAALRTAALARDKHVCRYCGKKATQADHIVARSKGGADALENLAACCARCNKIAGGTLFPFFAAKKRFIRAALRATKMR